MRPLLIFLGLFTMLVHGFASAQQTIAQLVNHDTLGAKLPLVTVGDVLQWQPQGDSYFFTVPLASRIKLSVYSPSINLAEVGDETYSETALTASFTLTNHQETLASETFSMGSSSWYTLYEGDAPAGEHTLKVDLTGKGKDVYYLKLESETGDIAIKTYAVTVNASDETWQDALSFDIRGNESCYIDFYDGDGDKELEAQLIQPSGFVQGMSVSEDLTEETRYLPRLPGRYTIQLRLPAGRFQKTNSVRFSLLCNDTPAAVTVIPAVQLDLAARGDISVEVIDRDGQPLAIPFEISDTLPRTVTLAEDAKYRLVDIQTEAGTLVANRSVSFGFDGGHVTYILEATASTLPLPDIQVTVSPSVPIDLPKVEVTLVPEQPNPERPIAARPIPVPEISATYTPVLLPDFVVGRSLEHNPVLACEAIRVTIVVENRGAAAGSFTLREQLPAGFELLDSSANQSVDNDLVWHSSLEAGEVAYYTYSLLATSASNSHSQLRGILKPDADLETIVFEDQLQRADIFTEVSYAEGNIYTGDTVALTVTLTNPLERELTVYLTAASSGRTSLPTTPASLKLAANGSASAQLELTAEEAGKSLITVTPFACPLDTSSYPAGPAAFARLEIAELAELPAVRQTTTVIVDISAYNLPYLDRLVLVEQLPEGADYIAGSTRVNGLAASDPERAGNELVFELPDTSAGQISFTVLHTGTLILTEDHSSLIGFTPNAEVLLGQAEALEHYAAAQPILNEALVRERVGAVILSPTPNFVLRDRDRVSVSVDTDLQAEVALYVNSELVPAETIGQKVYDPNINRQTFDYIGVPIVVGPNTLTLESRTADGSLLTDEVTVYFAGPATRFSLTPLSPLVADSAEPLALQVQVFDDWGNTPLDDFLTLEFSGLQPVQADASPERVGFQVRMSEGGARLELQPVDSTGTVSISAILNGETVAQTLTINSNLRPWIVAGVGSAGASYAPGSGLDFGLSSTLFARGRVFEDYLLTLSANYPLAELGPRDSNPYQQFPVSGSSGVLEFDAFSSQGVFARLERNLGYIQYGDFSTHLVGEFLDPARNYTGLSSEYAGEQFSVRAYSAYVPANQQVSVDLPSDGTSIRFLPDAPIRPGSLSVRIVKKDVLGRVIPEDDKDKLTRTLSAGVDYRVDEEVGLLELYQPVPIQDSAANTYSLQLGYKLLEQGQLDRFVQFGFQAETVINAFTLRAGISQETVGSESSARVIAGGVGLQTESLQGDVEIAYGHNQSSGGVALSTRFIYRTDDLSAEASWRYLSETYRSPNVSSEGSSGHTLSTNLSYNIIPEVSVAVAATLSEQQGSINYSTTALSSYSGNGFDTQFGVNLENNILRPVLAANIYDPFGWQGSRFGVSHLQGFAAATSQTSFSVSLPLLPNLNLTLTDELIWGQSNAVLLGLEASLSNNQTLASLCRSLSCNALDPSTDIGTTTLTAQYEVASGVSAEAGSVRLGIHTTYPITDTISIDAGIEHVQDFNGSQGDNTIVTLAANYDTADIDGSLKYEVAWNEARIKQSIAASTLFAVSDQLFASIDSTWLSDSSSKSGFRFGLATAYRGERITLLSNNNAQFNALAPTGDTLTGDTRLSWLLSERTDLRLGYAYTWNLDESYLDMMSAGTSLYAWQGGNVLLQTRLFHDWSSGDTALGAGIEVSQQLGCGLYGAAGYNVGGLDKDYGAVHNGAGAFVRLDVVFDEEWRCGDADIGDYIWHDANANGLQDASEVGIPGVRIDLFSANNELAETAFSDSAGHYHFRRVDPGDYYLRVTAPAGYSFSNNVTTDPTKDSDVSSQGYTGHFALAFGETKDVDVGLVKGTGN